MGSQAPRVVAATAPAMTTSPGGGGNVCDSGAAAAAHDDAATTTTATPAVTATAEPQALPLTQRQSRAPTSARYTATRSPPPLPEHLPSPRQRGGAAGAAAGDNKVVPPTQRAGVSLMRPVNVLVGSVPRTADERATTGWQVPQQPMRRLSTCSLTPSHAALPQHRRGSGSSAAFANEAASSGSSLRYRIDDDDDDDNAGNLADADATAISVATNNNPLGMSPAHTSLQTTPHRRARHVDVYNPRYYMTIKNSRRGVGPEAMTALETTTGDDVAAEPQPRAGARRSLPSTSRQMRRIGKLDASGGLCESIRLSYTYTLADVARRSRNLATGALAVFLLVFFTGVAVLGTTKVSYVLLRLSELTVGEADVEFRMSATAGGGGGGGGGSATDYLSISGQPLNFTALEPLLQSSGVVVGASPRWMMRGEATQADATKGGTYRGKPGSRSSSSSDNYAAAPRVSTPVNVLIADTSRERAIGIGRSWPHRGIGYGEVQVYDPLVRLLAMTPNAGERLNLYPDKQMMAMLMRYLHVNTTLVRPMLPTTAIDFLIYLLFTMNNIPGNTIDVLNKTQQRFVFTLADAVTQSYAKYTSALANVVLLDYKMLLPLFVEQAGLYGSAVFESTSDFHMPTFAELMNIDLSGLDRVDMAAYAMSIPIVLRDRYATYYAGSSTERDRRFTQQTNAIMLAVGITLPCEVTFPIAQTMTTFDSFKSTLLSIFIVVVVGTVVLCTILVFTLLIINADERQFELAMLRAQGMPHTRIAVLLLTQTMAFALPGTVIGVLFVWAANAVLERVLANQTKAPMRPFDLPASAAVTCAVLGVVMPFVAAYGPVRRALSGSLRDALDVYRQAQNETHVVMTRLEDMGLKMWQVVTGVFLAVLGFALYYLLPLSLLLTNTLMFFALLDVVLLCFVISMCLVVHVLEPYAESLLAWLMMAWGPDRRLHILVTRNLHSHRSRNSKAFMTFMLTIACLTASGIMFLQLSDVTTRLTELQSGAPITVTALSFDTPLNKTMFDSFLATVGAEYASTWAYSSFALTQYPQMRSSAVVSNYFDDESEQQVITVTDDFLAATYSHLNVIARYKDGYEYPVNAAGIKDPVKSMYAQAPYVGVPSDGSVPLIVTGSSHGKDAGGAAALGPKLHYRIPALIAQSAEAKLGIDVQSGAQLRYAYGTAKNGDQTTTFALELRAELTSLSGFPDTAGTLVRFSGRSALLVPEPYFLSLLNATTIDYEPDQWKPNLTDDAVTVVRYKTLYVQLHRNVTQLSREALVNALQARINASTYVIVDAENVKDQMKTIKTTILIFFYIIAVICIVVCGLMMWLTFIANVQLSSWSVGVLRALGFHLAQLVRASVYEALSIVLSGFVLGIAVGLVAGVVLSLQMANYQSLPLSFDVPYVIILVVFGLALLAALCGSTLPYIAIARRPIAIVLRHM